MQEVVHAMCPVPPAPLFGGRSRKEQTEPPGWVCRNLNLRIHGNHLKKELEQSMEVTANKDLSHPYLKVKREHDFEKFNYKYCKKEAFVSALIHTCI